MEVVGGAEGSLVWVRRKNGTWWPGRVVGPTEISPSAAARHLHRHKLFSTSSSSSYSTSSSSFSSSSSSAFKIPVMLLGKDNHSVGWYYLEKTKQIKAFRCGEFDDCIRKAESSQASTFAGNMKYVRRKDAILHALALEKKDAERKLKRTGEVQAEAVHRAKRSRYICLPIQSQSSKVSMSQVESDDSTFVSAENNVSVETKSAAMEHDHKDADRGHTQRRQVRFKIKKQDELCQLPRSPDCHLSDGVAIEKEMQKGRSHVPGIRGSPSMTGERLDVKTSTRKQMDPLVTETRTLKDLHQEDVSRSALIGSNCCGSDSSAYIGQQNGTGMTLVDVELTVKETHRGNDVPFICLVSKASGKAVIGHPIDVEVLHDRSENLLRRIPKMPFEDDRSRIHQLAWRTSRRTPVCYISNSNNRPTSKTENNATAGQSFSASRAKGSSHCLAVESSGKSMKKCNFSQATKCAGKGNDNQRVICVPVKQVFSKLFEAVVKF